jgi:hypothetical protein
MNVGLRKKDFVAAIADRGMQDADVNDVGYRNNM